MQLGVSFYSLQALSYVTDVYRRKYPAETNFLRYLLGKSKTELLLIIICISVAFLIELFHERNVTVEALFSKLPALIRWIIYTGLTAVVIVVYVRTYGTGGASFIYAGF